MGDDERDALLGRLARAVARARALGWVASRLCPRRSASRERLAAMKAQVYKDPRPEEYFDRFHERSRTREPDWVYEVVRVLTSLYVVDRSSARAASPPRTCRRAAR